MRTSWLVGIVLTVHAVALGFVLMMQGCGTTKKAPPAKSAEAMAAKVERQGEPLTFPPPAPGAVSSKLPSAGTTEYVVIKGDSLSSIAKKFKLSVAEIKALNNLGGSDKLKEGQKLVLPSEVDAVLPSSPKKTASPVGKPKADVAKSSEPVGTPAGILYMVKAGDALSKIAKAQGSTVEAIQKANGLKGDAIRVGQKLIIPASGTVKKDTVASVDWSTGGKKKEAAPKAVPAIAAVVPTAEPAKGSAAENVMLQKATEPAASGAVQIHTVGAGEDLDSVAMLWNVSVTEIKKLNGLTDDAVKPGQALKIPMSEP